MICFSHIPKTAGTTFRYILINNYSWQHIDIPENLISIITLNDFPFNSRLFNTVKSLSGHPLRYSKKLKDSFPNIQFVAFIRDPISRIISLYGHAVGENMPLSFREWAIRYDTQPMFHNFQTNFICGSNDIESAKNILQNEFFLAGSSDLFEYSLLLFKRLIGEDFDIRSQRLRASSVSRQQIVEDPANRDVLAKLREYNELDNELNEFVKNNLIKKIGEEYGNIDNIDLDKLREANRDFSFNQYRAWAFKVMKYLFFQNIYRLNKMRE